MKKSSLLLSSLLVQLTLLTVQTFAQNPHADRLDPASLDQQGKLVNLRIVPADKNLKIFLAGKKGADINLDKAQVTATVRLLDSSIQELKVNREIGYYTIPSDLFQNKKAKRLELKTNVGKESETFSIELR